MLGEELPSMVVSDIAMPCEDGFSLVQRVRESSDDAIRRLPLIALTAYSSIEERRRMADAGFDVQLAKPIEPSHLAAAARRLVQCAKRP